MNSLPFNVVQLVFSYLQFDDIFNFVFLNKKFGEYFEQVKFEIKKHKNKKMLFDDAIRTKQYQLIKYLIHLKKNFCNDGLVIAASINDIEMIKFMISRGATNFSSAIPAAAKNNHMDIVKFLISKKHWSFRVAMMQLTMYGC